MPPQPSGPRSGTRTYNHRRAVASFPDDAEDVFVRMLHASHESGRRRRTAEQLKEGICWFTNPAKHASTSKAQTDRHWWKTTFRFQADEHCLYALPTKKHPEERRVIAEEDFFKTIVYEHDINGPGGHQHTAKSLLKRYYGPTRKEAVSLLKRCVACGQPMASSDPEASGGDEVSKEMNAEQQGPLPGDAYHDDASAGSLRPFDTEIPHFTSAAEERRWLLQTAAASCRLISHFGFDLGCFGGLSFRDPAEEHLFWLSPVHLAFGEIKASDLQPIRFHGSKLGDDGDQLVDRSVAALHESYYRVTQAKAVISGATTHIASFSAFREPVQALCPEACAFSKDRVGFTTVDRLFSENHQVWDRVEQMKHFAVLLIQNVGVVIQEQNPGSAFIRLKHLDRSCHVQLTVNAAESRSRAPTSLSDDSRTFFTQGPFGEDVWTEFSRYYRLIHRKTKGQYRG